MFDVITLQLSGDVASSGTFDVSYPTNRSAGDYTGAYAHKMYALGADFAAPSDFTVAFGASDITVTYKGATTIPEGSVVRLQIDRLGTDRGRSDATIPDSLTPAPAYLIDLGSPIAANADGILDGVSATTTVQTYDSGDWETGFDGALDVPRALVATGSDGSNHVVTVTGTDVNGNVVVESITLSGTNAVAGKKAFKTVTGVSVAGGASGDTVDLGWTDVLGLPVFLPDDVYVLAELEDGGAASAGTIVAGVTSAATATTGDVRGTYDPATAADGSTAFALLVSLPDPSGQGVPQYAG